MKIKSWLRKLIGLKPKIRIITNNEEAVNTFYQTRLKDAIFHGVRTDVDTMEVFYNIRAYASPYSLMMHENLKSTRKIKWERRIQIQHGASNFDIKIRNRTTIIKLKQDPIVPLLLSEHEFGSINIHITENGDRCFSGKIKLAKDVPIDGSAWSLARVTYLRTPMVWEEKLRDALGSKITIPNPSSGDLIERLKKAVEQSKVP